MEQADESTGTGWTGSGRIDQQGLDGSAASGWIYSEGYIFVFFMYWQFLHVRVRYKYFIRSKNIL
jgi:hypothetical protein